MKQKYMLHASGFKLHAIVTGGGQEFGFRSGTENVPLIVGFAEAVKLVSNSRERWNKKIKGLRDYFWRGLKKICPKAESNGHEFGSRDYAYLPNMLNVCFPGHPAQDLITKFDLAGLAISADSACSARSIEPSHVIEALGYSKERAKSSLRFSFGRPTTKKEVDIALQVVKMVFAPRLDILK